MGDTKDRRLNIRLSDEEHTALSALALFKEVSLQTLVHDILVDAMTAEMGTPAYREAARAHIERQARVLGVEVDNG